MTIKIIAKKDGKSCFFSKNPLDRAKKVWYNIQVASERCRNVFWLCLRYQKTFKKNSKKFEKPLDKSKRL